MENSRKNYKILLLIIQKIQNIFLKKKFFSQISIVNVQNINEKIPEKTKKYYYFSQSKNNKTFLFILGKNLILQFQYQITKKSIKKFKKNSKILFPFKNVKTKLSVRKEMSY